MTYIYAAIAVVGALLGAALTHAVEGGRYAHLETTFANYKAAAASQRAIDELAARTVLQEQIDNAAKVSKENDSVIQDLNAKLASSIAGRASDRTAAQRVFHDAAACSTPSNPLPETPSKPAAATPSGKVSLDQLANACSDLAAEDERNADRLDSLIREIKPQL